MFVLCVLYCKDKSQKSGQSNRDKVLREKKKFQASFCGGQSGSGTGVCPVLPFSNVSIILPLIYIRSFVTDCVVK